MMKGQLARLWEEKILGINSSIDILIDIGPVKWADKKKVNFVPASNYGKSKIVLMHNIPWYARRHIEEYVEYILCHEDIHIILTEVEDHKTSFQFDKLFPTVRDMVVLLE